MGIPVYTINRDFFLVDSEEYWYFLGFVASDGYISDDKIEIGINKKDISILQCFKDIIQPEKPLYHKPTTNSVKMTTHSRYIAQNLKEILGMVSNLKSKEITFPNIPSCTLRHFIRGIIDGDGCIDTTKGYRGNKIYVGPRLRILGRKEFLVDMIEAIREQVPNKTYCVSKKGTENVWYVTYNFKIANNILEWCYFNNSISLARKKERFLEVTSQYRHEDMV
jgi:hypothetical protein